MLIIRNNNQNLIKMKILIMAVAILFAVSLVMPAMAQTTEKEASKALNKKVMKKARKEAKKYKKSGFYE